MLIEKTTVLPPLMPVLGSVPRWHETALQRFMDRCNAHDRIDLGPNVRASMINRFVLAEARQDPVIAGNFSMMESDQLECIVFEGEGDSPNLSLVFNKATRNPVTKKLRTSRNRTERRDTMRHQGVLPFEDRLTIPLVIYYELDTPSDIVLPSFKTVGIGHERSYGFRWIQPLWSIDNGLIPIESDGQFDDDQAILIPQVQVRLKRPSVASTQSPSKIGIMEQDKRDHERSLSGNAEQSGSA